MNTATEKTPKFRHPNCGEVEIISRGGKESLVRLASGEERTVTTEWLKEIPAESPDGSTQHQS